MELNNKQKSRSLTLLYKNITSFEVGSRLGALPASPPRPPTHLTPPPPPSPCPLPRLSPSPPSPPSSPCSFASSQVVSPRR